MTYRSPETALRERLAVLDAEVAELEARRDAIIGELVAERRASAELEERIAREGPGGGLAGARTLGIPFIVGAFFVVSLLLVPATIYIGSYASRDPEETIVPLLLLCGPGLTTSLVARPYRHLAKGYEAAAIAGALLVGLNLLFVLVGAEARLSR